MAKSILLIVEGDADEVSFYRHLFSNCFENADYQIIPYRTNIHILAQELYCNYPNFENDEIDIRLVLASLEQDEKKKKTLLAKYTDIYLVFDFDPHHDHPHFDTVRRMLSYFCDSTLQGKLYINYPMMQSYKHFSHLPDPQFFSLIVDYTDINNYKKLVGQVSGFTDLNQYDYSTFYSIAAHHLMKAHFLINGDYILPSYDEYFELNLVKLYDYELNMYDEDSSVAVINTCIFVLFDYAPQKAFRFLASKRDELLF